MAGRNDKHGRAGKGPTVPVSHSYINDPIFAHILIVGLCFTTFNATKEAGWAESNPGWVIGTILALLAYVVYFILWLLGRRANMSIEFRDHDVWLPPAGHRTRGATVRYRDIRKVTLGRMGRSVRITWRWGFMIYGRDNLGNVRPGNLKAELDGRIRLDVAANTG